MDEEDAGPCRMVRMADGTMVRVQTRGGRTPTPEDMAALEEFGRALAAMCDAPHPTRAVAYGPNQGRPYRCSAFAAHPGTPHWRMTLAPTYDAHWEVELWDAAGTITTRVSDDYGKTWADKPW